MRRKGRRISFESTMILLGLTFIVGNAHDTIVAVTGRQNQVMNFGRTYFVVCTDRTMKIDFLDHLSQKNFHRSMMRPTIIFQ